MGPSRGPFDAKLVPPHEPHAPPLSSIGGSVQNELSGAIAAVTRRIMRIGIHSDSAVLGAVCYCVTSCGFCARAHGNGAWQVGLAAVLAPPAASAVLGAVISAFRTAVHVEETSSDVRSIVSHFITIRDSIGMSVELLQHHHVIFNGFAKGLPT